MMTNIEIFIYLFIYCLPVKKKKIHTKSYRLTDNKVTVNIYIKLKF